MSSLFPAVSGVAFDLDETLYDRDAAFRHLMKAWFPGLQEGDLEEIILRDATGYSPRAGFFAWLAETWPAPGRTWEVLWHHFRRELPLFV